MVYLILFLTAMFQVALVAANTFCISKKFWFGIAFFSLALNMIWQFNVQVSANSEVNLLRIIVYGVGGMLGALLGVFVMQLITKNKK